MRTTGACPRGAGRRPAAAIRGGRGRLGRTLGLTAAALLGLLAGEARASASEPPLPTGAVIERVACLHDAEQTYALYLPSHYRPEGRWPILYAFDPMARGTVPTRLFSKAAERLGYIVAASNNSRNGPVAPIRAALEAVWKDTHDRLAIDPERVYTTGMSGGTLPALLLGLAAGRGVVACAGAVDASQFPPGKPPFAWLGIAGDADFNFDLTKEIVEMLVERGTVARFATFEGGHGWPPEDLAARALDWLDVSAMRAGTRPADAALVEAAHQQGQARARDLVARSRQDGAAEELATLARELEGLMPVEALRQEAQRLRQTPEAERERKQTRTLAERTRAQRMELTKLRLHLEQAATPRRLGLTSETATLSDLSDTFEEQATARDRLDRRLAALTREIASADEPKRLVARRVMDGFYIETYYVGWEQRAESRYGAAEVDFDLCATMRPKNPAPVYEKARTRALRGDRKKAFAELERAIGLGFSDLARLSVDPEWDALRERPEYKAIVEALRARP